MIYLELFISFLKVGLFSIGGGYAAMPLIQSQVVTLHNWLTMQEFTDLVTIAEMTPGPIAINAATFVGTRMGGFWGAVSATLGCIFPSFIIVSFLAFLYYRYKKLPMLQSILSNLRPAVVAIIASAGLTIFIHVIFYGAEITLNNINFVGIMLFSCAFFALRRFKCNPIFIMIMCGIGSLIIGVI